MTAALETAGLKPAFADPVFDSQETFRSLMTAVAYPGRIETLTRLQDAPAPLCPATAALCLTLVDLDTPLWLDAAAGSAEARAYLRFHCGAPLVAASTAARIAVAATPSALPPLTAFDTGREDYPDRSCTLVLQVPSLTEGPALRWSGPGIRGSRSCRIAGLPDRFWSDWALNRELYPLGLDVIFVTGCAVVGLPRGIEVEG